MSYLKDKEISIDLKKKLIDICTPVMIYDCGLLSNTKRDEYQPQIYQQAVERKILKINLNDKINNIEIRSGTIIKKNISLILH